MVKAVILFIAHAGLSQCMQWLHWHLGNPDVALKIFCRPDYPLYGSFERLPFFYETTWGSPQLVYVQQEAYQHILQEHPETKMIFMVSGNDIPIVSIEKVLEIADQGQSYVPKIRGDDGCLLKMARLMPKCWPQDISKDQKDQDVIMPKYQSIQWIHLTANHARLIADFPLWKLQCIHTKMQDLYNEQGLRPPIADEYWAITILSQFKICCIDKTLTEQDRMEKYSPSPILWESYSEKKRIFIGSINGKDTYEITTLAQTIEEAVKNGALFYRKISKNL